ncbi:hypothetical protein HJC23_003071 [Cyclotella cryptica]|uniref:Cyclin-dependent kinase 2 homolog n=1 Tax=Cyclotella cryptica TaxID=29204 RepID=A0ABD3PYF3_9STRA
MMGNRNSHKRRRKERDSSNRDGHGSSGPPGFPASSSSEANTPSWITNMINDCSLLPTSKVAFGRCTNVSSRYEKLGRIGEGTYGVVYRARDEVTGDIVALKRCLPHHEASDGFPLTTLREITLLRELQHGGEQNGIVMLKDVAVSSSRSGVFLIFEYAQHDLATLIDGHYKQHNCSPFRESEVKRLMLQLLRALSFLHSRHILHRDVKLSNLLYNHRGELRVADFGLARRVGGIHVRDKWFTSTDLNSCLTPKVVSLWYRPPELLFGSEFYDMGVDNWGAGCTMGELLLGKPLMNGKNELEQLQKMVRMLILIACTRTAYNANPYRF